METLRWNNNTLVFLTGATNSGRQKHELSTAPADTQLLLKAELSHQHCGTKAAVKLFINDNGNKIKVIKQTFFKYKVSSHLVFCQAPGFVFALVFLFRRSYQNPGRI